MRTVVRTALHNLTKLQDELLAAIEALRPTPTGPDGQLEAVMLLGARGDEIMLQVPDEVTDEELDAVLDAHDPAPLPPPPGRDDDFIGDLEAASTAAQIIAALRILVLRMARRGRG